MIEFHNYEVINLSIVHAEVYNLFLLLFILVALSTVWVQKSNTSDFNKLLDISQTNQLRGEAILCVVIGHFWVHVVRQTPQVLFGGDAVALFLLLSGFGLTISGKNNIESVVGFFYKRGRKILLPYWISTVLILSLDFLLLDRTYSWQNYFWTSLGVNVNSTVRDIDYVRWYITFQLFWYLFYALIFRNSKGAYAILLLFAGASFLFVFDYYVSHFGWYQIFAFPCGVLLAYFYGSIATFFERHAIFLSWIAVFIFCLVLLFKIYSYQLIEPHIPSIVFKAVREVASIALCLCAICFIGMLGRSGKVSVFLSFCGGISYELFLLHGPFLVKYNPIICPGEPVKVILSFLLYLAVMILFAFSFKRIVRIVNESFA